MKNENKNGKIKKIPRRFIGITEKRLQNRRFRKTEEAILRAFFESDVYVGASEMAKMAGVARSTFYQHHHTVRDIIFDYEKHVMRAFGQCLRKIVRMEKCGERELFTRVLLFIIQNKEIFAMFIRAGDVRIFARIVARLKPELVRKINLPQDDRIFNIYASEIVGVLWRWGEQGFKDTELGAVLGDIVFLTKSVNKRLLTLKR